MQQFYLVLGLFTLATVSQAGDVALSEGSSGRLFIYRDNEAGTVCDDDFGDTEAVVVCRQLGYTGGTVQDSSSYDYDEDISKYPVWLDGVSCEGHEASLDQCQHNGWGEHNCDHFEDVHIKCQPKDPEPVLFLSNGDNGLLQVVHLDVAGTLCDDHFSDAAAEVACRQMGYAFGFVIDDSGNNDVSGLPIWLDDVSCGGDETSLFDCDHNDWGEHNCDHDEDVYLQCVAEDKEPIHASGQNSLRELLTKGRKRAKSPGNLRKKLTWNQQHKKGKNTRA